MQEPAKILPQTGEYIGCIEAAQGPVVDVRCETLPSIGQALELMNDGFRIVLVVCQHLQPTLIRAIALHSVSGLYRGMAVYDSGAALHIPVEPGCLAGC